MEIKDESGVEKLGKILEDAEKRKIIMMNEYVKIK